MKIETITAISPISGMCVRSYRNIEDFGEDDNCIYFKSRYTTVSIPKNQLIIEIVSIED